MEPSAELQTPSEVPVWLRYPPRSRNSARALPRWKRTARGQRPRAWRALQPPASSLRPTCDR